MWSKLTNTIRSRIYDGSESASDRESPSLAVSVGSIRQRQASNGSTSTSISSNATNANSQGDVLTKVFEQHPNLSVFQPTPVASPRPVSPFDKPDARSSPINPDQTEDAERPLSPQPKKGMFKRITHRPSIDIDTDLPTRSASPFRSLSGLPKKVKSSLNMHGNGSQGSLNRAKSPTLGRFPSQDVIRPTIETHARSSQDTLRSNATTATSTDVPTPTTPADLQHNKYATLQPHHPPSSFDAKYGGASVRSILRDPNTPGTGQNVRFFSRDAYKTISPEDSAVSSGNGEPTIDSVVENVGTKPSVETSTPFLDTLRQAQIRQENAPSSESGTFPLPKSKKSRPSVDRVFSPLREIDTNTDAYNSNVFDDAEGGGHIHKPPGLDGALGQDFGINFTDFAGGIDLAVDAMTSTPHRKTSTPDTPFGDTPFLSEERTGKGDGTAFFTPLSAPFQGTGKAAATPSNGLSFSPLELSPPSIRSHRSSRHSHSSSTTSIISSGASMRTSLTDSTIPENDENQPQQERPNVLHKQRSSSSSPLISGSTKLKVKPKKRTRSTSEGVFRSLSTSNLTGAAPEGDINDISSPNISFDAPGGGRIHKAKSEATLSVDPFGAEAKPFYPPTLIPPTPPRATANSNHTRNLSKEESVIFNLQSQLALQADLCVQYQADLASREETVNMLERKLRKLEEDEGKKRTVLKAWKKKVAELERICRSMEDEVERSREDKAERSVMDEASGEAMRHMHRQIAELERTVEGVEKERQTWQTRCDEMQSKLDKAEETERELRKGIADARQEIDEMMGNASIGSIRTSWASAEEVQKATAEMQRRMEEERNEWQNAEAKQKEEMEQLVAQMQAMKRETDDLRHLLSQKDEALAAKDEQLGELQTEVEAQWGRTEQTGETMAKMSRELADLRDRNQQLAEESDQLQVYAHELEADKERLAAEWADLEAQLGSLEEEKRRFEQRLQDSQGSYSEQRAGLESQRDELQIRTSQMEDKLRELVAERDSLREEVETLETRTAEMEEEWTEAENRKSELDNELQELWSARDELEVQLSQSQDRVADLEVKTTEQEHRISSLALEHQFVKEQVTKLESDIAKKSSELSGANALLSTKEDELERLRDELSNLSREHSRLVASQSRDLAEQTDRAGTSKKQLEELIRSQARAEAENNSLNDRVRSLSGELDRMRKLVHNLQHESADKDLKLAQAKKQQDKDAEELRNFNIALDSKQQELELMKRNFGVRGTAGSTPATAGATSATASRRNSIASTPAPFARPRPSSIVSRPSSVASDISTASASTSATKTGAAGSSLTSRARRPSTAETPKARSVSGSAPKAATSAKIAALHKNLTSANSTTSTTTRPRVSGASPPVSAVKSTLNRSTSRPSLPSVPSTPVSAVRKKVLSTSAGRTQAANARNATSASPIPSTDTSITMSEAETTPAPKKIAVLN